MSLSIIDEISKQIQEVKKGKTTQIEISGPKVAIHLKKVLQLSQLTKLEISEPTTILLLPDSGTR